jgi:hypothetical protein
LTGDDRQAALWPLPVHDHLAGLAGAHDREALLEVVDTDPVIEID